MSFFAYLPYIAKGLQVFSLLAKEVPVALADGKITVEEVVGIFTKITAAFGMPIILSVPENIAGEVIKVKE